jgi:hypothetical protein
MLPEVARLELADLMTKPYLVLADLAGMVRHYGDRARFIVDASLGRGGLADENCSNSAAL